MSYDPVPYWDVLAKSLAGPGAASPEHERQEAALIAVLKPLYWRSVLEVGVGGGRITALLHEMRPKSRYTGIDIGETQLARARKVWPEGDFFLTSIEDFDPRMWFADESKPPSPIEWDLVITSEVLMHVTPDRIKDAIANVLAAAKKHVVLVEWDASPAELAKPIAEFNFAHDYRALLGDVTDETRTDRQVIFHVAK